MKNTRPKIRRFVVACLAISLSIVGVLPRLSVASVAGFASAGASGTTSCCCGTSDGRCCGMACCTGTAPRPEKNSGTPSQFAGSSELGLTELIDGTALGFKKCIVFSRTHAIVPASGAPSLCSLKVRLQI